MDGTVIKIDAATAPVGPEGEVELALGTAMAMRLWDALPPGGDTVARSRDYETVGYVVSGRATLELEGGVVSLEAGSSWVVPPGVSHRYIIEEAFTAVEATSPPAPIGGRDAPPVQ